jgi:hypothetical protein
MNLFDSIQNGGDEYARYTEPSFVFLNRTSRKKFSRIRDLLQEWFDRYPASEQQELKGRFRSPDDFHHQAAFFELFLHELLLRLNCKVILHPSLEKTKKVPDFLVDPQSDYKFYLEATVATGESANESAAKARENTVYDVLDRLVKSPDYFLSLSIRGAPQSPPPAKKLALFINSQINLLNYEQLSETYKLLGNDSLPTWHFEHDGWQIDIKPLPKAKMRGKTNVRPIGVRTTGFNLIDDRSPIRAAIIEKGNKYGDLDLPYVVAVNAIEPVDEISIFEALYGKEEYSVDISNDSRKVSEPILKRIPDGAWTSLKGPRYTRISAVLMVTRLNTYNIPRSILCLYHNPWAQKPCQSVLTALPQAIPLLNGEIKFEAGISANTIFNITTTWPEDVT